MPARDGSSLDSYSKDSYSKHFLADSTDSRVWGIKSGLDPSLMPAPIFVALGGMGLVSNQGWGPALPQTTRRVVCSDRNVARLFAPPPLKASHGPDELECNALLSLRCLSSFGRQGASRYGERGRAKVVGLLQSPLQAKQRSTKRCRTLRYYFYTRDHSLVSHVPPEGKTPQPENVIVIFRLRRHRGSLPPRKLPFPSSLSRPNFEPMETSDQNEGVGRQAPQANT